jgi:arylsulfatase A-like enzyme
VIDLLPTFAKLSGAPLPNRPLDGRSFALVLDRPDASLPPRRLFWAYKQDYAVRDGDWKLTIVEGISYLFNLRTDLGEQDDLAAANPAKVQELEEALAQWKLQVGL